jgi:hypothetical protein
MDFEIGKLSKLFLVVATLSYNLISGVPLEGHGGNKDRNVSGIGIEEGFTYYNVGVLMASRLDSPFDLERCGPAIDMALEEINEKFLAKHKIRLKKVQARYVRVLLPFRIPRGIA